MVASDRLLSHYSPIPCADDPLPHTMSWHSVISPKGAIAGQSCTTVPAGTSHVPCRSRSLPRRGSASRSQA
eukprot:3190143-Amphidinium_carterae.2